MLRQTAGALLLFAAAFTTHAQDYYLGASGGLTEARNFDTAMFGMYTTDAKIDREDFGYRGFAGAAFTRYFAIELGYSDLGSASYTGTTSGNTCCTSPEYQYPAGPAGGQAAVAGYDVTLIGRWPITRTLAMGPRVGLFRWTLESSLTDADGQHRFQDETGSDWLLGFNIMANLGASANLMLDYVNHAVDAQQQVPRRFIRNYDTRVLSVGVLYRFGG